MSIINKPGKAKRGKNVGLSINHREIKNVGLPESEERREIYN